MDSGVQDCFFNAYSAVSSAVTTAAAIFSMAARLDGRSSTPPIEKPGPLGTNRFGKSSFFVATSRGNFLDSYSQVRYNNLWKS